MEYTLKESIRNCSTYFMHLGVPDPRGPLAPWGSVGALSTQLIALVFNLVDTCFLATISDK
jgi:hypothetical protein